MTILMSKIGMMTMTGMMVQFVDAAVSIFKLGLTCICALILVQFVLYLSVRVCTYAYLRASRDFEKEVN